MDTWLIHEWYFSGILIEIWRVNFDNGYLIAFNERTLTQCRFGGYLTEYDYPMILMEVYFTLGIAVKYSVRKIWTRHLVHHKQTLFHSATAPQSKKVEFIVNKIQLNVFIVKLSSNFVKTKYHFTKMCNTIHAVKITFCKKFLYFVPMSYTDDRILLTWDMRQVIF